LRARGIKPCVFCIGWSWSEFNKSLFQYLYFTLFLLFFIQWDWFRYSLLLFLHCLMLFNYGLLLWVEGLVPELRLWRGVLLLEELLVSRHYLANYFVFRLREAIEDVYCVHLDGLKKRLCYCVLSHLSFMRIKGIGSLRGSEHIRLVSRSLRSL
jgi:hypothetical protein